MGTLDAEHFPWTTRFLCKILRTSDLTCLEELTLHLYIQ